MVALHADAATLKFAERRLGSSRSDQKLEMTPKKSEQRIAEVPALQVHQWLPEWDEIEFGKPHQAEPRHHFYIFSLDASTLKRLTGIQRRETTEGLMREQDLGIQRRHDPERSKAIKEFVQHGFPWSDLTQSQKRSHQFDELKRPGWLPTSIVVNILEKGDEREGAVVDSADLVAVEDREDGSAVLRLPDASAEADWQPKGLQPLEVIDGQHRLWAFKSGASLSGQFQLPVVAFHGLDLSWQAYLFWSINVKPKRISASLAFDLYPLLRTEDWLQRFEGPSIYRETRAQELVEILWAHDESPWHNRINMLGEPGVGGVTQAAWIRSLLASFIKAWEGPGVKIGGLFGAPVGSNDLVLPWTREQQVAFLIYAWRELAAAISNTDDDWANALRETPDPQEGLLERPEDLAFAGKSTLLNTDQGVRAFSQVVNDLIFALAEELKLRSWPVDEVDVNDDLDTVAAAIDEVAKMPVGDAVKKIVDPLAHFDWRSSAHESLTEEQRTAKAAFRGSGGYRELRRQLLALLEANAESPIRDKAGEIRQALKLN
jgi:DGQHR domain-containing protein